MRFFALVFVNVKDLSQCFVFNLIATWFFGLFFSSILTFGYVTIYLFVFFFSFSGIKYERERDGRKKISCSAQFCEKFQTFPIKINSKESSKYFFFCCCCARETKKFFFPFRYHKKKIIFSFSCSCSCSYFLCWKNILFSYHRTKSRHIREKEKGTRENKGKGNLPAFLTHSIRPTHHPPSPNALFVYENEIFACGVLFHFGRFFFSCL